MDCLPTPGFSRRRWRETPAQAEYTCGSSAMVLSVDPSDAGIGRLDHDDELAAWVAAVNFAARQARRSRPRLRRDARGAPAPGCWRSRRRAAPRRGSACESAAGDQGAAVDGGLIEPRCVSFSCSMRGGRAGRTGDHLVDPHAQARSCRPSPTASAGITTAVRNRNAKISMRLRRGRPVVVASGGHTVALRQIREMDGIRAVALLQI